MGAFFRKTYEEQLSDFFASTREELTEAQADTALDECIAKGGEGSGVRGHQTERRTEAALAATRTARLSSNLADISGKKSDHEQAAKDHSKAADAHRLAHQSNPSGEHLRMIGVHDSRAASHRRKARA